MSEGTPKSAPVATNFAQGRNSTETILFGITKSLNSRGLLYSRFLECILKMAD